MKKVIIYVLAGSTLMLMLTGADRRDTIKFAELIRRYYEAWSTLDPDRAGPLYAKDAELVFFDVVPLKYSHGWKEYRDNFKTNVAPLFASVSLTPNDDLKVTSKGDVALTTLTFHARIKHKQGDDVEFDGRHTLFWEKRGGKWLIVHEHLSKPL